jgi:glycosyltransferase involved in cell wall biosynthesis
MGRSLLVLIQDPLSEIIRKGELTDRYYNPGNLFENVHIVMTNGDQPDRDSIGKLVGDARLFLHNLPMNRKVFVQSLAWRPGLLRSWAAPVIALAEKVRPSLVRCYGDGLNGIPAVFMKEKLRIPYILSMHTNPDINPGASARGVKEKAFAWAARSSARAVVRNADYVLPVYASIVPYLLRMGAKRCEIAYNVINPSRLSRKPDYVLNGCARIVSVGRQIPGKNPERLIQAMRHLPGATLTLIGDGPLHERLVTTARESAVQDRVEFRKSVPNDELCDLLPGFDIFAAHTEYAEISKSVLEPLLTGLPVVINEPVGRSVPEFEGDFLMKTPNTAEGYASALNRLIREPDYRSDLGRKAYAHARSFWAPEKAEARFVELYEAAMRGVGSSAEPSLMKSPVDP